MPSLSSAYRYVTVSRVQEVCSRVETAFGDYHLPAAYRALRELCPLSIQLIGQHPTTA